MKPLSKEEVCYVAHLARLELSPEEVEKYQKELSRILDYVAQIQSLDTSDIPATFQNFPRKNVFRADEVGKSLPVEEVLKNAPEREGNYFKMPRILE